jgi:hypothetical protein
VTSAERFRYELHLELANTRDPDVRRIFRAAIIEGPNTAAWSEAIAILGLRQVGRDRRPMPGWEARVFWAIREHRRASRWYILRRAWHQVWPFVLAAVVGLFIGIGIARAITRWL